MEWFREELARELGTPVGWISGVLIVLADLSKLAYSGFEHYPVWCRVQGKWLCYCFTD